MTPKKETANSKKKYRSRGRFKVNKTGLHLTINGLTRKKYAAIPAAKNIKKSTGTNNAPKINSDLFTPLVDFRHLSIGILRLMVIYCGNF